MPDHPFKDNVVILTGASQGIGEQMAYQLAEQGGRTHARDDSSFAQRSPGLFSG